MMKPEDYVMALTPAERESLARLLKRQCHIDSGKEWAQWMVAASSTIEISMPCGVSLTARNLSVCARVLTILVGEE